jgi:hypothetical protein
MQKEKVNVCDFCKQKICEEECYVCHKDICVDCTCLISLSIKVTEKDTRPEERRGINSIGGSIGYRIAAPLYQGIGRTGYDTTEIGTIGQIPVCKNCIKNLAKASKNIKGDMNIGNMPVGDLLSKLALGGSLLEDKKEDKK